MNKLVLSVFAVCISITARSQNYQQKIDSVCALVQQNFNKKNVIQLYALTGVAFKKALPFEKFKEVCDNNLFTLGQMQQAVFEKTNEGISKYKAVFGTGPLAMFLRLDDKDKLETLLFNEYLDERPRKTSRVPSSNRMLSPLDKIVDAAVQPYISLQATTGLSVGILRNGRTYFYGYGETEKGNKSLPNQYTIFEIGSISKTFTALLLADAVYDNRIRLDDPINSYLPSNIPKLEFETVPITIKMLSNHSSGLPRMPGNFSAFITDPLNPYKNYSSKQLLDAYATLKLDRKPGTVYEYSNFAVGTLGAILEQIYQTTYEQLLIEKICNPLHMNDTRQFIRKTDSLRFAKGYNETGEYNSPWDFRALAPTGGIRSTTADMLQYAKAHLDNTPPSLKKAIRLTHAITFSDGQNTTALGWHYIRPAKDEVLFHNGRTGGFSSYLAINQKKNFAVVLLSNAAISTDEIGNQLMKWLEQNGR